VSVVRPIVATRSSGPPASQPVIKEMPGSVASGTSYRITWKATGESGDNWSKICFGWLVNMWPELLTH